MARFKTTDIGKSLNTIRNSFKQK